MSEKKPEFSITSRWTPKLAAKFCPVSSFFLANYHRLQPLPGARCLSSSEAMLLIQILDHKWTVKAPFPAVATLAKRMGISTRAVRSNLRSLETSGYLRREFRSNGKTSLYHLDGLYAALEQLFDEDEAKRALVSASAVTEAA